VLMETRAVKLKAAFPGRRNLYNGRSQVQRIVLQIIDDIDLEFVALSKCGYYNENSGTAP
jgi:hypothetical protein